MKTDEYKIKILHYIFLSLIFFTLVVPLIIKSEINTYDAHDEKYHHYPTVVTFLKQFPHLNLVDYPSATTPLYHMILALSAFIFGSDIIQLRLINSVISLFCLLVVYGYLSMRGNAFKALYFATIFMLSPYFLGPAIRLSTDNAALLFAFLSILAIDIGSSSIKKILLINILILCTILIRQIYAWLIGAYLLVNLLRYKFKQQSIDLAHVVLPTLIPIAGIVIFLFLWGGLTPPRGAAGQAALFAQRLNWDAPIYIVSLTGLYGVFFCSWLFKMNKQNQGNFIAIILLVGFAIGCLLLHPVSNEYGVVDMSLGLRGGMLWLIASRLPNFLSSSIAFWALFPIGLICLYVMARHLVSRHQYLMSICFSLWLMTSVINTRTYQKYYEPFILFSIGYTMMTLKPERNWYYWFGPLILLVGFMGVTLVRFF